MNQITTSSPRWSPTTKLLVGLVIVGIIAFLLYRFATLVTPLLMIFILAYLFHPLASAISRGLNVSWRAAVNLLYLSILIILITLVTLGGVGLVQQVQSLISVVQDILANLPTYVEDLSGRVFQIGPFRLDMRTIDLNALSQQLLSFVQPLLGRTGNIVGALASGAAEALGWTFFVLLVSYFLMAESRGLQGNLITVDVPGYSGDLRTLGSKLSRIWNAFLRGQIFIFVLATVIYIILLSLLGVRYALGLALMAGLAKFLPYIGPAITWVVMGLVTFFQPDKPFDLQPLVYTAIVVIITLIIDQIIDSFVVPRIMARTLKVHPAAVLVTALVAANLLGLLGVVIAAPFLASLTLLGKYTMRKMLDLEPWPERETELPSPMDSEWIKQIRKLWAATLRKRKQEIIESRRGDQNE
ncbi:MAG: AI-2E family transporter [Anaerolineae bacterium]|nr:AI-2E family transporter [Anaerolineae bacterium]MCI0611307.1 AI-2E family transporter [Anaerolineae bacterium]